MIFRPTLIGGWRNAPLSDMLQFIECEEELDFDITRAGEWKPMDNRLQRGREKFQTFNVPNSFLPTGYC